MTHSADAWYVRLPDSQIVRANSTKSVRHNIKVGRIPPESHARRSSGEPWTPLYRLEPFADLLKGSSRNLKTQPNHSPELPNGATESPSHFELKSIGVRGLVVELISALDSSLNWSKLRVAAYAAFFVGLIIGIDHEILTRWNWGFPWSVVWNVVKSLAFLLIAGMGTALLTQQTFIELSRLRSAQRKEIRENLDRNTLHLMGAYLVVVGLILSTLALMSWLSTWVQGQTQLEWFFQCREIVISVVAVVQILLQVILLPLLGFSLLLGPIIIVEKCSLGQALLQWTRMVWRYLSRLFLYEALVASMALIACLPFLIPVGLAAMNTHHQGLLDNIASRLVLWLLSGLALTPALAYLTVANVYIYLHLRYDQPLMR